MKSRYLPQVQLGRRALARLGLLVLPSLIGLSLGSTAAFASDTVLPDKPVASFAPATVDLVSAASKDAGLELLGTNSSNANRHTTWHSGPMPQTTSAHWIDSAIKALDPDQPKATDKAGNLGFRPGDLDPSISFHPGEPGIRRLGIDTGNTKNDRAVGVAEREDGKIYLVGQAGEPGAATQVAIARLNPNGNPDASFGNNGIQIITINNPQLTLVKAIGVMRNGYERFYILAQDRQRANNHDFALICLRVPQVGGNEPFQACSNFGSPQGEIIRYYDFAAAPGCSTNHDVPQDIFMDARENNPANFKFYLAGSAQRPYGNCEETHFAVLRVDIHGNLDAGFGSGGMQTKSIRPVGGDQSEPWKASAYAVARGYVGGQVVLGGSVEGVDSRVRAVLAQFTEDGAMDSDFCAPSVSSCNSPATHRSGVRAWSSDEKNSSVRALAVLPQGSVVYSARWQNHHTGNDTLGLLNRIQVDGGCEVYYCNEVYMWPAFNTRTIPVSIHYRTSDAYPGGQIAVAAYSYSISTPAQTQIIVQQFLANPNTVQLVHDRNFTTGPTPSVQSISFPGSSSSTFVRSARPAVMVPDRRGRFLIAGFAAYDNNDTDFAFARLRGDTIIFNDGFEN